MNAAALCRTALSRAGSIVLSLGGSAGLWLGGSAAFGCQAQAAPPIIARDIAWRGGADFLVLHALALRGRFSDGGLVGPSTFDADAAGNLAFAVRLGPLATTIVAGPEGAAYTNLSGQCLPLSDMETGFARSDATALLAEPLLGPMKALPDQDFEGQHSAAVEIAGNAGAVYDYFFSPASGALLGIRAKRDGGTEVTTFGDWRVVDGVRLPFAIRQSGDGGIGVLPDDTTSLAAQHVVLNTLPKDAFALPPDRDAVGYRRGDSSGWIHFNFAGHLIHLPITLNGRRVQAILDSGAGLSVLDSHAAAGFGLHAVGASIVEGEGGSAGLAYASGLSIAAGGLRLTGVTAGVIDLGLPGTQKITPPLVAVLGAEVFNQAAVEIDYARRRLRFLKPGTVKLPRGAVTLPLTTEAQSFLLPVTVEGSQPVPVLLDTGNDGTFQLYPDFWRRQLDLHGRQVSEGKGGGVGGYVVYRLTSLHSLGLGGLALHDIPGALEPAGLSVMDETAEDGNLGDEALSRFTVIIDFPERKISFVPGPDTHEPFRHDLVGIEPVPAGKDLTVFFVMPGSPAAEAGIRAGQKIVAINGRRVDGVASARIFQRARVGEKLSLSFADGGSKILTLRRFY